jgi:large subunit ribosomal protein L24
MRIKKGDSVKILYGKDSGSIGKVVRVLVNQKMVVVEGKNVYKKHIKGDGQTRKSEIVTIVKPMPVSKVQLVSPDTSKPTRVGYIVNDDAKVRISKKSGKEIDSVKVIVKEKPVKIEEPSSEKVKKSTKK